MLRTKRSKFFTLLTILVIGAFVLSPIGPLSTPAATEVAATEPSKVPSSTPTLAPKPTLTSTLIQQIEPTLDPNVARLANWTDRDAFELEITDNKTYVAYRNTLSLEKVSHSDTARDLCNYATKQKVKILGNWTVTLSASTPYVLTRCYDDAASFEVIDLATFPQLPNWIAAVTVPEGLAPDNHPNLMHFEAQSDDLNFWHLKENSVNISEFEYVKLVEFPNATIVTCMTRALDQINHYELRVVTQKMLTEAEDNKVSLDADGVNGDIWLIKDSNHEDVQIAIMLCNGKMPKLINSGGPSHYFIYDAVGPYFGNLRLINQ